VLPILLMLLVWLLFVAVASKLKRVPFVVLAMVEGISSGKVRGLTSSVHNGKDIDEQCMYTWTKLLQQLSAAEANK